MIIPEEFNPTQGFDNPREALEYCNGFPDPKECFLQVIRWNMDMDELGFSRELLDLWYELEPRKEIL